MEFHERVQVYFLCFQEVVKLYVFDYPIYQLRYFTHLCHGEAINKFTEWFEFRSATFKL